MAETLNLKKIFRDFEQGMRGHPQRALLLVTVGVEKPDDPNMPASTGVTVKFTKDFDPEMLFMGVLGVLSGIAEKWGADDGLAYLRQMIDTARADTEGRAQAELDAKGMADA